MLLLAEVEQSIAGEDDLINSHYLNWRRLMSYRFLSWHQAFLASRLRKIMVKVHEEKFATLRKI